MAESALSMDLGLCLSLLVTCSLLYFLIQFIRLIMADSDLTLQWAEYFGHTPESKLGHNVVWVTGASSGIGEELSYQLAKLGCPLILSSRRENELLRVKQKCLEISSLEDQDILILPLDMTQMSMHKEATEKALQHFGRQVLQHMIERKRGRIVNISSAVGLIGAPLSTGYSASKHALQGFFNSLRTELTTYPDIIISNICPGPVQSNIVENALTEECDKVLSIKTDQSHKMATERCARLVLITAANNLKETWISGQPFLMGYYLWQYTPTWAWWLTAKVGERRIKNFKSGVDADSSYFTKKSK
ncbi:dehydrogenase/reductase SDR family member 7 isoform X2 [Xenopus laevis]|uniref:Dehydrogenase/reductase SDR family member 7 isoform X2 n=1 Tax=Xenopus laevis TaxID=8355 RepID=A0A8J1LNK2_XENLA|nr:dehydrogenase/reductase SDR family member 7 isoform X2 [Xenopus laevis]